MLELVVRPDGWDGSCRRPNPVEILLGGYPELAVGINISEVHKLKYRSESLRIGDELATFLM